MTSAEASNWQRSELAYCSNVHPCDTLESAREVICRHVAAVRRNRNLETMSSGLWLSAQAARELSASNQLLRSFADLLKEEGIQLTTLNGFPYGEFHGPQVKAAVYRPDWSQKERLAYTLDLAKILAHCLPPDQREGTISTLPLGFAPEWSDEQQQRALAALCDLTESLHRLHQRSGRKIRVCLEMEPGCRLESTDQAIILFTHDLPQIAQQRGLPEQLLQNHLGLCYDICHQAVMFEEIDKSLSEISRAGIEIGKIQISSALELGRPDLEKGRQTLASFVEPRYLHQVRTRDAESRLQGVMDLAEALLEDSLPRHSPWRVHFHLPIQTRVLAEGRLATTRDAISQVLDHLSRNSALRPHLEVETYTWQVLPDSLRPSNDSQLHQGLGNELRWLEREMSSRGLLRETAV